MGHEALTAVCEALVVGHEALVVGSSSVRGTGYRAQAACEALAEESESVYRDWLNCNHDPFPLWTRGDAIYTMIGVDPPFDHRPSWIYPNRWLRILLHLLDLSGLRIAICLRLWTHGLKIYRVAAVDQPLDH